MNKHIKELEKYNQNYLQFKIIKTKIIYKINNFGIN